MTKPRRQKIDYSIVVPVYFNAGAITETVTSLRKDVLARNPALRGEIIFVDDGSGDGSLDELLQLRKEAPRTITVVKLTRNFGQCNALYAGFGYARGECVIVMSADGQDPPELINQMLVEHFEKGYRIVICARQGRDDSYYRVLTSKIFYTLMRKLSFPSMPRRGFDFMLFDRTILKLLLKHRELNEFLQGHVLWTGFKPKFIYYDRLKRTIGRSRWSFGKKVARLIDSVLGYSSLPIRIMSVMGLFISLLGVSYAGFVFLEKIIWGIPMHNWALLVIVILIVGGLHVLALGIHGEYLLHTLAHVRNRPQYVIEKAYKS